MRNKNSFFTDVLTLTSVPLFSQLAGILLTPIVTRMYPPEAFGLANALGSLVMIIAVFSTMGYHGSLVLPKSDNTASILLYICFLSILIISIASYFIILFSENYIIKKLNTPELKNFLWLTPIFVLSHGLYQTLRYWNTRMIKFNNIAISRIMEILLKKLYQIPAGLMGYATSSSIIFAELFATTAKNIILFKNVNLFKKEIFSRNNLLNFIVVAKRYKKFPLFSVWAELFSRVPALISSIMIIKFFGQNILGYYGLTLMVLALPSTLISGSVSEAFMPRAARAKHEGKHTELLEKIYLRLIVLLIFPFMILGLFGSELFVFVFGSQWAESGMIARVLIFYIFFEIIFSPSLSLIDIMEKQELNLIKSISNIIIVFLAFYLGSLYNDFYLSLWIITFFQSLLLILIGSYMMRLMRFPFLLMTTKLIKYFGICIILGGLAKWLYVFINQEIIFLLIILTTMTIIYYSILLYLDKEMMAMGLNYFTKFKLKKKN